MDQTHLPLENPKARAKEDYGPSSTLQSTEQFCDVAEDNSVLGRSKTPPEEEG